MASLDYMTHTHPEWPLMADNTLAVADLKAIADEDLDAADLSAHGAIAPHSSASLRATDVNLEDGNREYRSLTLASVASARSVQNARSPIVEINEGRFPKINILGIDFDNVSKLELLSQLNRGVIFTPNVDHLMKLRRDPDFAFVYQRADYKICDSQILIYAAKFLGKPLKAKLSGSDLFHWFCDYHQHNDEMKIFLLGGRQGVAKEAQRRINARIGRPIVVGEYSPPVGFERDPQECQKIIEILKRSPANVVAVCLGAPKQEKWIAAHRDRLPNVDIFMAIWATVDFEAGVKPRAPKFASEVGLEWVYRLLCEPRRLWKRYLLDGLPFIGLVLAEKLRSLRPAGQGDRDRYRK